MPNRCNGNHCVVVSRVQCKPALSSCRQFHCLTCILDLNGEFPPTSSSSSTKRELSTASCSTTQKNAKHVYAYDAEHARSTYNCSNTRRSELALSVKWITDPVSSAYLKQIMSREGKPFFNNLGMRWTGPPLLPGVPQPPLRAPWAGGTS